MTFVCPIRRAVRNNKKATKCGRRSFTIIAILGNKKPAIKPATSVYRPLFAIKINKRIIILLSLKFNIQIEASYLAK